MNKFCNLTADCAHENSFQSSLYKTLTNKDLDHIIEILKTKYNSCSYYSDASKNTLIALNPCESKPSLYSESIMNLYREWSVSSFSSRFTKPFPPHIFKYAAVAWKILTSNQKKSNQTLLVSGESGSGKTKSINFIMSYFVYVSNTRNSKNIESILLSTNPILEAFGNASTKLNENSSRFGKYIQLFFSDSNLVSAHIVTYLLEKTRSLNEFNCRTTGSNRNFHVFYECVLGANDLERNEWHLTQTLIDKYLNLNLMASKYVAKLSLLKLSFSELDIFCFFNDTLKLVSAIAHLNCCSIFDGLTHFEKTSTEHLELASKLLGFDIKDLENYMLVHELKINYGKKKDSYQHLTNSGASFKNGNSNKTRKCLLLLLNGPTKSQENLKKITILKKHCNSNEIKQRLNCLIKLIYTEMFKWIVNKINVRLNGPNFDDYKLSIPFFFKYFY
jgi:myosin heavy subunit